MKSCEVLWGGRREDVLFVGYLTYILCNVINLDTIIHICDQMAVFVLHTYYSCGAKRVVWGDNISWQRECTAEYTEWGSDCFCGG